MNYKYANPDAAKKLNAALKGRNPVFCIILLQANLLIYLDWD